jgi:hypothetical protein
MKLRRELEYEKKTKDEIGCGVARNFMAASHDVTRAVVKIKAELLMRSIGSVIFSAFIETVKFFVCFETLGIRC